MLRKLLNKLKGLFNKPNHYRPGDERSQPKVKAGDKVGGVTIGYLGLKPNKEFSQATIDNLRQSQLDKHTDFKIGESYRLGESIVTLHPNKASMLAAIAKVDAKREAKHKALRERGIDLMLMSPEELAAFKLDEWLSAREKAGHKLDAKVRHDNDNIRYIAPKSLPPEGTRDAGIKRQFEEIVYENALDLDEDKEKV
jgi:hypothetical protein